MIGAIATGWAIAAVLMALGTMMALLKAAERWLRPPAELTRKLLHVGMGLVVLSFPWVFDAMWPVVLLSAVATAAMLAVRLLPVLRDGVGTVISGVQRSSLGEIYFVISVGTVWWLSRGDWLLYCVPMLIMTLADAMAALIGLAYGKVRFVTTEGLKSAEGSIAFFAIAFLSVHVPLLLFTDTGRPQTLLIAVIIGVLAMLLEAIAWRGLDNLLIPLGAYALLKHYLEEPAGALGVRLVVTVALLVFALSWRRRSSLDDSALMAAALFGLGAWMLGGPAWLLGPILLFIIHVMVWPRVSERRVHSVFTVLAVVATAMLWLTLWVRDGGAIYFIGYATTFAVHLALFCVSYIPREATGRALVGQLAGATAAGWMVALVQWTPAAWRGWEMGPLTVAAAAALGIGVAVGATGFAIARRWLQSHNASPAVMRWTGFAAGLTGTLVAVSAHAVITWRAAG